MVAKLLGDPTYFPVEFRRWLSDFLQNSDFKISQSQIMGGGAGGGSANPTLLPAGIILPYATTNIGKDCLVCDGLPYARTDYPELFDAIGTTWNAGQDPGSDRFRVPDLKDRALFGIGSVISLAQTDGKSVGNRGGPYHHHNQAGTTDPGGRHTPGGSVTGGGDHAHGFTGPASSGYIQQGTAGTLVNVAQNPGSSLSTNNAAHSHGLTMSQVSDHSHGLSGPTSGGYDLDRVSFAGVRYVITTGRAN